MLKKFAFLLIVLSTLSMAAEPSPIQWQKLDGCTLVEGKWKDGDRFRFLHEGKEYFIRLYFVDCPENKGVEPSRTADQAGYFGCPPERITEIGLEAAEFIEKTLSGKSFTVFTFWEDARGKDEQSPKYYGIVNVDGNDLAALLVEDGLARIYRENITLPGDTDYETYWHHLEVLEADARYAEKGGWKR